MKSLRSRRVVTPQGMRPATVVIDGEKIVEVRAYDAPPAHTLDAGNAVVMPGLVDAHVHVNDPGRAEWEGFDHATRAAAAGGVTTLVDMPLNSVPATVTPASLDAKIAAAAGRLTVDVGFWGGVVPGNAPAVEALWQAGALGFKCFLVASGVPEFGHVTFRDLEAVWPTLARLGAPLLAHAELPGPIDAATAEARARGADPRVYATYLASRPVEAETTAIEGLAEAAARHGARVHVVHVSSIEGARRIAEARKRGVRISGETCPHYLTFEAADVPDGATVYKCAPPVRDGAAREGLWAALADGALDFVASDHSPSPASMKTAGGGDFFAAWGGIASLQLLLPATWSGAAARGGTIERLADWLCARPARLAGIDRRKGTIAPGHDADFVVWDPEAAFVVAGDRLYHRHPLTPYAGRRLRGVVRQTWLRGEVVYDGTRHTRPERGAILSRGTRGIT